MKRGLIIILSTVFWLSACGGGGDRRAPPAPAPPPQKLQDFKSYDFTLGQASSKSNAEAALMRLRETGALRQVQNTFRNKLNEPFEVNSAAEPPGFGENERMIGLNTVPTATMDTKATQAWAQGWTGKDVKVAIVDDFQNIRPTLNNNSHGEIVRAIAWQIAPEASVSAQSINLRLGRTVSESIQLLYHRAGRAFDEAEKANQNIVNASFGVDPYGGYKSPISFNITPYVTQLMAQTDFAKLMRPTGHSEAYDEAMLFIFAAGNGARGCASKTMHQCTIDVQALLKLRESIPASGDKVMFVGALADEQNTMAAYSYTAGELKNDFIVAHDDIWQSGDGSGTSFAAPRVTGAAALVRHKFPNLNGPQLKQVLLQSADDIGAKGVDEVFGHGKLNVMSALSPIEGLTR